MRSLLAIFLFSAGPAFATSDPVELRVMVRTEALKQGLPAEIADAVVTVESNYSPGAVGDVGEIGLMQVLPSTARMLGFAGTNAELADPAVNIRYGVDYLAGAWKLAGGDVCTTAMKYRAGHGETRFSHKSVAYCVRVREVLSAQGYPLRGEVPKASFGAPGPVLASGVRPRGSGRKGGGKSRVDWAAYDRRIKAIQSRISSADLTIMR